jgi:hypothetical protein
MRIAVALLAASLLGADSAQPSGGSTITYQYQILDMSGLEWRSALYPQLQPIAHQGAATIWTAPACVVTRLVENATRVVACPKVAANPSMQATVFQNKARHVVRDVNRVTDNHVTTASFVGFEPRVEEATEGYSVVVSGRKIDQGILAQISIDDKQIVALHPVTLTETRNAKEKQWDKLSVTVQVPEFARTEVSGEWLIPNDGVLIVSLGAHTTADEQGKAIVRERLAVVDARSCGDVTAPMYSAGPIRVDVPMGMWRNASRPAAIPLPMPLPMTSPAPLAPSRTLPLARDASGEEAPLPPLPEELAPPTALPGTSQPCATPQHKGQKDAPPASSNDPLPLKPSELHDEKHDPASKTAGYDADSECCAADSTCPLSRAAACCSQKPAAPKTFSLRLPLNDRFAIEIHATARPAERARDEPNQD